MSVLKNYIYITLYQIMVLFIPLITMPYLTRIFTPDQLGLSVYTYSVSNYFVFFGLLGMQLYGNRQIAYVRDNKEKLTKTFWSLYLTQIFTCSLSLLAYCIFIGLFINNNTMIYIIQGLNIISVLFDISWLFMGLEDFKKVVVRNTITKILGLISIFAFVKDQGDLIKYIFIIAIVNVISILVMWIYVPKQVGKIQYDIKIIKKTVKPLLSLFLPQIAVLVYTLLARTLIGILSTNEQVLFYDYSQKIVRMVLALISSIGIVLMPGMAKMIGRGKYDEASTMVEKVFKYVSYISIPMAIGLMSISNVLVPWFLGTTYSDVGYLSVLCSLMIIPIGWANVIGIQYLVATKQENKYTFSIFISAIINLIMNMVLIKKYGAYGATISLVVAESVGVFIQMILVRKQLRIKNMLISTIRYFIGAVIMGGISYFIGTLIKNGKIANIIQISVGIVVYISIMLLIKDDVQSDIFKKVSNLFKSKLLKR